jgi:hypothetical protein
MGGRTRHRWAKKLTLMLAAVLLLISALPSEVPVSAGVLSWSEETIPDTTGMMLAPGTDVSDLAVAGDNTTIYATDREAQPIPAQAGWSLPNPPVPPSPS